MTEFTTTIISPLAQLINADTTLHMRGSDAWMLHEALTALGTPRAVELAQVIAERMMETHEAKKAARGV